MFGEKIETEQVAKTIKNVGYLVPPDNHTSMVHLHYYYKYRLLLILLFAILRNLEAFRLSTTRLHQSFHDIGEPDGFKSKLDGQWVHAPRGLDQEFYHAPQQPPSKQQRLNNNKNDASFDEAAFLGSTWQDDPDVPPSLSFHNHYKIELGAPQVQAVPQSDKMLHYQRGSLLKRTHEVEFKTHLGVNQVNAVVNSGKNTPIAEPPMDHLLQRQPPAGPPKIELGAPQVNAVPHSGKDVRIETSPKTQNEAGPVGNFKSNYYSPQPNDDAGFLFPDDKEAMFGHPENEFIVEPPPLNTAPEWGHQPPQQRPGPWRHVPQQQQQQGPWSHVPPPPQQQQGEEGPWEDVPPQQRQGEEEGPREIGPPQQPQQQTQRDGPLRDIPPPPFMRPRQRDYPSNEEIFEKSHRMDGNFKTPLNGNMDRNNEAPFFNVTESPNIFQRPSSQQPPPETSRLKFDATQSSYKTSLDGQNHRSRAPFFDTQPTLFSQTSPKETTPLPQQKEMEAQLPPADADKDEVGTDSEFTEPVSESRSLLPQDAARPSKEGQKDANPWIKYKISLNSPRFSTATSQVPMKQAPKRLVTAAESQKERLDKLELLLQLEGDERRRKEEEIASLKKDIEEAHKSMKAMRAQYGKDLEAARRNLEQEASLRTKESEDYSETLEKLQKEYEDDLEAVESMAQNELKTQSNTYEAQIARLQNVLDETNLRARDADDLQAQLEQLEKDHSEELEFAKNSTLLESETEKTAELNVVMDGLKTDLLTKTKVLVDLKKNHTKELKRVQDEAGRELETATSDYKERIAKLQKESDDYQDQLSRLERDYAEELELVESSATMELEITTKSFQSQIDDLQATIKGLRTDLNATTAELAMLHKDKTGEFDQVQASYKAQISELQANLTLINARATEYKDELAKLQQENADKLDRVQSDATKELETKTTSYEQQILHLRSQLDELKAKLQTATDRSEKQETEIRRLEQQASSSRELGTKASRYEARINELQKQSDDYQLQLRNLERDHSEELELAKTNASNELETVKNGFKSEIDSLQTTLQTMKADLEAATRRSAEQEGEKRDLEHRAALSGDLEKKSNMYEAEIIELRQRLDILKSELNTTTTRSEKQVIEIRKLEQLAAANDDLESKTQSYKAEIRELIGKLGDLKAELRSTNEQSERQATEIRKLELELETRTKNFEKEINGLRSDYTKLEADRSEDAKRLRSESQIELDAKKISYESQIGKLNGELGILRGELKSMSDRAEKQADEIWHLERQSAKGSQLETQVKEYQEQIAKLRDESKALKMAHNSELEQLKSRTARELENEMSRYEAEVVALEKAQADDRDALQKLKKQHEEELHSIKESADIEMERRMGFYESQVTELQNNLGILRADLRFTTERSEKQADEIRQLEKLRVRSIEQETRAKSYESQVDELRQEFAKLTKEHTDELKRMQDDATKDLLDRTTAYEKQLAELQTRLSSLELEKATESRKLEKETASNKELDSRTKSYEKQVADLRRKIAELEKDHAEELKLARAASSKDVDTKTSYYESQVSDLQAKLTVVKADLLATTYRSELQAREIEDLRQLSAANRELEATADTYRVQLSKIQKESAEYRDAMSKLKREHEIELMDALKTVKLELETKEKAHKEEVAILQKRAQDNEEALADLKRAHADEFERMKSAAKSDLEKKIIDYERQVTKLTNDSKQNADTLSKLKKDHSDEVSALRASADKDMAAKTSAYESQISALQKASENNSEALNRLRKYHSVELKLVENAAKKELEATSSSYEAQISELRSVLESLKTDLKSTAELETKAATYKARMDELQETLTALQTDLESANERSAQQAGEISKLEQLAAMGTDEKLAELQGVLDTLNSDLKGTLDRSDEQSLKIRKLEVEKKSVRKQASNAMGLLGDRFRKRLSNVFGHTEDEKNSTRNDLPEYFSDFKVEEEALPSKTGEGEVDDTGSVFQ